MSHDPRSAIEKMAKELITLGAGGVGSGGDDGINTHIEDTTRTLISGSDPTVDSHIETTSKTLITSGDTDIDNYITNIASGASTSISEQDIADTTMAWDISKTHVILDATAGDSTVLLPLVDSNTFKRVVVVATNNSINDCIIDANGASIEPAGVTSYTFIDEGSRTLYSNGLVWRVE